MAKSLLERIQNILMETLAIADYVSDDINKVLLVGGGCRMPMIQQQLHKMFTKAEHSCHPHPDEMIAIGAAHYATILTSQNNVNCSIM